MLYFHPWEFDAEQEQLPLGRLSRFRTYSGIASSRGRLDKLMSEGRSFVRAIDVAQDLRSRAATLPQFSVGCGRIGRPSRERAAILEFFWCDRCKFACHRVGEAVH